MEGYFNYPSYSMYRQRPAFLLATLAAATGGILLSAHASAASADDGTTGSGSIRYLSGTTTWTTNHRYDSGGSATSLCVGTGAGAGKLLIQSGARVEVPAALFIAGKGYGSAYSIDEGKDGLVEVGPGSVLECGGGTSSTSAAQVYVGWGSGVKGTLRVRGGEFISNCILRVGCHVDSNGLMEVLDGGRATLRLGDNVGDTDAIFLSIATDASSQGLLRLSGGSTLVFEPEEGHRTRADIGAGGTGTLLIEGRSRASLGQDYAFIGTESNSSGLVHVRGGSRLELPRETSMALAAGAVGTLLVEGKGSQLVGQALTVGAAGNASVTLQQQAVGELSGRLSVGSGGTGRVSIDSGAQLSTRAETVVGSRGSVQLTQGGQWRSTAPVTVQSGGSVSLSGASRWAASQNVDFQSGSTLAFAAESASALPEVAMGTGSALTLSKGSHLQVALSLDLLEAVAAGELEIPLIRGTVVGTDYEVELLDASGIFSTSTLRRLSDGRWGLSVSLDRPALRRTLSSDASRLANTLWSSTGGVQDFSSAVSSRPYAVCKRNIWGMGLGSFSRMESQAGRPGYDYNGGGYAVGADVPSGGHSVVGFSFGQLYGTHKSTDALARVRQNSLMGSLYARYDSAPNRPDNRSLLDAYATYGRVSNRARSSMFSTGAERSSGKWSDDVYALGLRASWERPVSEHVSLLPFIGLSYLHGSHGSFTLASLERSRSYSSASMHSLSLPVGATLRARYGWGRKVELVPELTLAYVGELSRNTPHMSAGMLGERVAAYGVVPGRHAFMLRAGAAMGIGEHWTTGIYYNLECREHEVAQAVDVSVGYSF